MREDCALTHGLSLVLLYLDGEFYVRLLGTDPDGRRPYLTPRLPLDTEDVRVLATLRDRDEKGTEIGPLWIRITRRKVIAKVEPFEGVAPLRDLSDAACRLVMRVDRATTWSDSVLMTDGVLTVIICDRGQFFLRLEKRVEVNEFRHLCERVAVTREDVERMAAYDMKSIYEIAAWPIKLVVNGTGFYAVLDKHVLAHGAAKFLGQAAANVLARK